MAIANPDILCEVEGHHCVTVTGEQQVLVIKGVKDGRIFGEVNKDGECAVLIVDDALGHVPRSDVVVRTKPLDTPPARGHTDLIGSRICSGVRHVERSGLHLLPSLGRNLGDGLAVSVRAFKGKAVCTVPANCAVTSGIVVLPDHGLDGLPVTFVSGRYKRDGGNGQKICLAVNGINLTFDHGLFFRQLLGKSNCNIAGTLAVEIGIINEN